jgi:hypothetical protein
MIGRHKGLWQDHRSEPSTQQSFVFWTVETPEDLCKLLEMSEYEREFGQFLDLVRWEDDGGMIYDKA